MRQIHRERVRRDIEPVPRGSQVLEQLHLVVPVIHKPLVEQRRRRRVPQQHVRLLEVREEAAHLHERDIRGDGEPIGKDVELRVRRFPREYVCADAGLGGETGLGVETGLERGFVGRKVLESEESAVVEGLAAIEDLLAVEEEDREDGGDAAVAERGRETKQLAVGVGRGPEIHVEDLEVRGADVADREVAEKIHGEEPALRH